VRFLHPLGSRDSRLIARRSILSRSYWAAEAVEWCYHDMIEDIERTRPPDPSSPGAAINGFVPELASAH
jgi:hypothetical protein